jgi:hypothetical protein
LQRAEGYQQEQEWSHESLSWISESGGAKVQGLLNPGKTG